MLKLDEFEPQTVVRVLDCMYTGDYPLEPVSKTAAVGSPKERIPTGPQESNVLEHAKFAHLAQFLNLRSLRDMAISTIKMKLDPARPDEFTEVLCYVADNMFENFAEFGMHMIPQDVEGLWRFLAHNRYAALDLPRPVYTAILKRLHHTSIKENSSRIWYGNNAALINMMRRQQLYWCPLYEP
ncbi:hypothetical protein KEM56_006021 [Ascosphaera pollenicola]|nr:hypothetical protein KEM56_006021 [Ascosphaera pollenicola]